MVLLNRRFASRRRSRPDEATVSVQTGDHKYQKPNRLGGDPFEKLHCNAAAPAPVGPIGVSPRARNSQPMSPPTSPSPTRSILKEPSTKRSEDDVRLFAPVDFVKSRTGLSMSTSIKRKVSFGPDVKPGPKDACSSEMNAFLSSLLANIDNLGCSAERLNAGLMSLSVGMKECAGGASEESRDENIPETVGEFALANKPLQSSIIDDPIIADRTLNPEIPPIDTRDTRESTIPNHAGEREGATSRWSMVNSTRYDVGNSSDGIRVSGLRPSTNTPRETDDAEAFSSLDPTSKKSTPPKRSRFVMKKQRSVVEKNKSLSNRFSSKNRKPTEKTSDSTPVRDNKTGKRRKKGKMSNLVMTGLTRPLKKPMQIISGGIKSQLSPRMRLVLTAK
ncbi:hypothetical protein THAOC_10411 [Thalassiosira oceanica]|uniref:Uncharacterized protein n=1 Tax=Thalassiosira oceanica TaxID=159749 RepID=K0TD30_THAOC|nr:hypothetical protein THAOC_10411 [Thalassiosira oceanica]|eukprot:EJK68412.1 hypothetical protein THAOC_10411 [Thalassiosira oceanica]